MQPISRLKFRLELPKHRDRLMYFCFMGDGRSGAGAPMIDVARDFVNRMRLFYPNEMLFKIFEDGPGFPPPPVQDVDVFDAHTGDFLGWDPARAGTDLTGAGAGRWVPGLGFKVDLDCGLSPLTGKRVRGFYSVVPGVVNGGSSGELPVSQITLARNFARDWLAAAHARGVQPAVWHRPFGGPGGLAMPVLSTTIRPQWHQLTRVRETYPYV